MRGLITCSPSTGIGWPTTAGAIELLSASDEEEEEEGADDSDAADASGASSACREPTEEETTNMSD